MDAVCTYIAGGNSTVVVTGHGRVKKAKNATNL